MDEYEICLGSTAIVVQYYSTETQEFIQEKQVEYCKTLGGDWTGVCYMFLAYSGDLQFSLVGQGKSAVETCDIIFQK
ncbi:hypothetical protein TRFO_01548 [Tritrichomonas foetus]|uniref:Uncharacterized protein n=1 Tax=Tritrichomonas foetus TaxID=1144522 RepID=A0A1J4JZC4_9EUKA|nr:hypothetical protein TRFO_01548 [Tritrichomonas foetus]|eukprot:OHT03840.1 hypothetical protein TRFO_01548 [Tritrichomonas foetus]